MYLFDISKLRGEVIVTSLVELISFAYPTTVVEARVVEP